LHLIVSDEPVVLSRVNLSLLFKGGGNVTQLLARLE